MRMGQGSYWIKFPLRSMWKELESTNSPNVQNASPSPFSLRASVAVKGTASHVATHGQNQTMVLQKKVHSGSSHPLHNSRKTRFLALPPVQCHIPKRRTTAGVGTAKRV